MIAWFRKLAQRGSSRRALCLCGGGVLGGMYEVGALKALDEVLPGFRANDFDIYVGTSAGSVVAALLANGVRPADVYRAIDEGLPDPLNMQRGAVYDRDALGRAARRFGQVLWVVGTRFLGRSRHPLPDLLAKAQGNLPPGFFGVDQLETYMRDTFEAKDLSNDFRTLRRTLLIPAVDLDRAERVVFGLGDLAAVPISQAIAASSAIPGFFEPYTLDERDYVDGGVGEAAHADLAVKQGAQVVVVVNPLVPMDGADATRPPLKKQGFYSIMEQSSRMNSRSLLRMSLDGLRARHPRLEVVLVEPRGPELFGPSMGFEASRHALRFGYSSTKEWLLDGHFPERASSPRRDGVAGAAAGSIPMRGAIASLARRTLGRGSPTEAGARPSIGVAPGPRVPTDGEVRSETA